MPGGSRKKKRTIKERVSAVAAVIKEALTPVDPIAKLREMDAALVAKGWPPISPWWWNVLEVAYRTDKRENVIRGGRRGGKSTTMCRVAVFEAVYGQHVIPPGDTGYFGIISAEKDQAKERLATCAEILSSLGITHRATAYEIEITDARAYEHYDPDKEHGNTGIRVFTASLQGVVSFTAIGALCDEEARWRDRDSGANPAKQVLGTLKPTMLTNTRAKTWHVSAPWSTIDVHYEKIELGNTRAQNVFIGTSWEMNPTITEDMTHVLEEDEQTWSREYGAVPMPSDESKFFSAAAITDATKNRFTYETPARTVAGGDFAFRRDATAWVVLDQVDDRRIALAIDDERVPVGGKPLVPSVTIQEAMADASVAGADSLCCDLHYIETVREELEDSDIELVEFPSDQDGIAKAYVNVRVLIAKGRFDLSRASKTLIDQLKNTTALPTDGAGLSIKNKRTSGHHGDSVSAFVCAVYATTRDVPDKKLAGGERRFGRKAGIIDEVTAKTKWHDNAEDWRD